MDSRQSYYIDALLKNHHVFSALYSAKSAAPETKLEHLSRSFGGRETVNKEFRVELMEPTFPLHRHLVLQISSS
jgi:hypothetical protein